MVKDVRRCSARRSRRIHGFNSTEVEIFVFNPAALRNLLHRMSVGIYLFVKNLHLSGGFSASMIAVSVKYCTVIVLCLLLQ